MPDPGCRGVLGGDGRMHGGSQQGSLSKAGFAGNFFRFGTGVQAKLSQGSAEPRKLQRGGGTLLSTFPGYESADPTLPLSSLLSPRCAMLSVSDQD